MNKAIPSLNALDAAGRAFPAAPARPASRLTAAGDDDRIPRVFLGAVDLVVLATALLAANLFAPFMQQVLLSGGLLEGILPNVFLAAAAPRPELFPPLSEVIWLLAVSAPVTLVAVEVLGGYRRLVQQSPWRLAAAAVGSQAVAISFSTLIVFALKLSVSSRVLIFSYGLLCAIGLLTYRTGIWTYQRRRLARGIYAKNVLLIGQPATVGWMIRHFAAHVPQTEFRLAGWLSSEPTALTRGGGGSEAQSLVCLGDVADLGDLLVHNPIHEVIAIQSAGDREWLGSVMPYCNYFRVRLRVVPAALLTQRPTELQLTVHGDPLRLPEVVLTPPHLDADAVFLKRVIDIVVAGGLLFVLSPLFLLIAIAIKLTTPRLPVFYAWRVIGLNGRPFTGHKFTTMVADADDQKHGLLDRNEMNGPVFKLKADPRITPLGRFLRKFSLNELPQLWSVVKGDMSLVGPRPAFRHELDRYDLWHKRKLCVKPGITCLWQVSGRNRITNFDDWVQLDLDYIDRWSLWLDIRILGRTLWAVVSGSGS